MRRHAAAVAAQHSSAAADLCHMMITSQMGLVAPPPVVALLPALWSFSKMRDKLKSLACNSVNEGAVRPSNRPMGRACVGQQRRP